MSSFQELITEVTGKEKNFSKFFLISIIILAIIFISSVFYTVGADSVGVVWTLGKITDETSPGINFKIPIVQTVNVIPTRQVLRREIGFMQLSRQASRTGLLNTGVFLTSKEC
jgi:regulator of protease activity HflC (stomatin/prohibitin superfamily)